MASSAAILFLIFLLIMLIVCSGYFVYRYMRSENHAQVNNNKITMYDNNRSNTIVLFKTHIWNDDIEKFVKKLKNETTEMKDNKIDFYVLMHSDNFNLINQIKDQDLRKYVLMFREADIKKIYKHGFYSMWLSNHWILMWFYKQLRDKYQYYWSIEYDVRISGNSSKIWTYIGTEDFVYPIEPFKDLNWGWKNHYAGNKLTDDNKYYGYLQLARYSNNFLKYLDSRFEAGENGQDEMIIFSLFKLSGLSGTKTMLNKLIKNSWSVANSESDKHKKMLSKSETKYQTDKNNLCIYHPIK